MQSLMFYTGSAVIILWGIGHLIPTRNIVSGFGDLSADNRRIITMEWLIEGITLCFIGVLVGVSVRVIGPYHATTHLVVRACAIMLFVLAVVSVFTGARTAILPMKLCPYVKSAVAIVYIVGTQL